MLVPRPISITAPSITYTNVPSSITPSSIDRTPKNQGFRWRYVFKEQVQATSELDIILIWLRLLEATLETDIPLSYDSAYCFKRYLPFFVKYSKNADISINSDRLIDLAWQKSARKTLIITMMPNMELAYGAFNEGEKASGVVTLQEMELVYGNALKLYHLLDEIA